MQTSPSAVALPGIASSARAFTAMPALMAAFLGAFLLWGVGFSHISVVHNAAHDVRHSSAFPCH